MDYSYRGEKTIQFEKAIENLTNFNYIIATNTGTSALHLAYISSGIEINQEVFVPALTFIGTVNPLSYIGAIPHFCDVDQYLTMDMKKLDKYIVSNFKMINNELINNKTRNIVKAIIPVHLLGNPCDMEGLNYLAKKYNLNIIEDACQAFGSEYTSNNTRCYSFNGNKIITTGGGGAICTNNVAVYIKALYPSVPITTNVVDSEAQHFINRLDVDNIPCENASKPPGSVDIGVQHLQALFDKEYYYILEAPSIEQFYDNGTYKQGGKDDSLLEFESYQYDSIKSMKDGVNCYKKELDHSIDATRYLIWKWKETDRCPII